MPATPPPDDEAIQQELVALLRQSIKVMGHALTAGDLNARISTANKIVGPAIKNLLTAKDMEDEGLKDQFSAMLAATGLHTLNEYDNPTDSTAPDDDD